MKRKKEDRKEWGEAGREGTLKKLLILVNAGKEKRKTHHIANFLEFNKFVIKAPFLGTRDGTHTEPHP